MSVKEMNETFTMLCLTSLFASLMLLCEAWKTSPLCQPDHFFFGPEEEFWLAMNWASLCEYKIWLWNLGEYSNPRWGGNLTAT